LRIVCQITVVVCIDVQGGFSILGFIKDKGPGFSLDFDATVLGSQKSFGALFDTLGILAHFCSQWPISPHALCDSRCNECLFDLLAKNQAWSHHGQGCKPVSVVANAFTHVRSISEKVDEKKGREEFMLLKKTTRRAGSLRGLS